MTTATAPAPTADEIRQRVTTYMEAEYRVDPEEAAFLALGNVDNLDPWAVIVDHGHVTDDDAKPYFEARHAALAARAARIEAVMRDVFIEAETEAIVAFLERHPWAPLTR